MQRPSPAQIAYHIGSAIKHKAVVMSLLLDVCKVLIKRGIVHDLSKFSAFEIRHYAPIIPLLSKVKYGTPEYMEAIEAMKPGVRHHYIHNDHHPEFWSSPVSRDLLQQRPGHIVRGIQEMSPLALIEMVADWKAANLRQGGSPEDFQKSIEASLDRFRFTPQQSKFIRDLANELGW